MIYSNEMQFLAKFIFDSNNCGNPSMCHTLIIRKHTLRLVPCTAARDDDIHIFRLMPAELKEGITRERWIKLTDKYIEIKEILQLNDHGGKNGPNPKNSNNV